MLPYKTMLHLDKSIHVALYVQVSNELVKAISGGLIPNVTKLPGARRMADLLSTSRRTILQAYDELEALGWVNIVPNKGVFISSKLPITKPRKLIENSLEEEPFISSHFPLNDRLDFLEYLDPPNTSEVKYVFDTGYPDVRLSPKKALTQSFHRILNSPAQQKILNYSPHFDGHPQLKKELAEHLRQTRGLKITTDQIFITRGSLMAFTCIFQTLLSPGDQVVVGDVSFKVANHIIQIAGGKIRTVPVDEHGINIDALAELLKSTPIRAVFVMPHHHHPTTVSLSAERRMQLLQLAGQYHFAIIEDDYDYDFHYSSSSILPMASADQDGTVIYVGSLSKNVAPGLRMGFMVAPQNVIKDITRLSRFIDCHGNPAFEKAIASLFQEGIIRRHLKKALKIYRSRRDHFCALLASELGLYTSFKIPEGGLAVWVQFNAKISLPQLRARALQHGLLFSRSIFQDREGSDINAIRMGFASMDEVELIAAVALLKQSLEECQKAMAD